MFVDIFTIKKSSNNCFSPLLDLDVSKQAASTPFHRTDVDTNKFKFLIHMRSLFRNLPNPGNLSVRAMTLNDLKSSSNFSYLIFSYHTSYFSFFQQNPPLFHVPPWATNMKHLTSDKDDVDYNIESIANLNIRNFPNPEDIYSLTLGAADTSQSTVNIPNVCDEDGKIITPD